MKRQTNPFRSLILLLCFLVLVFCISNMVRDVNRESAQYSYADIRELFEEKKVDKVKVTLSRQADEVMVKAMCALGATPIHALGFFGTWDWRQGGPNGAAYLAGSTNQLDVVGDPGAAEKFGAFMRRTFLPAADLLAGLGNAPARVAYLLPRELYHSGNYGWEIYKCQSRVGEILADLGLPFDVLYDAELTPETLSRYRVALLPQAACLTEEHVAVCRQAAEKGTVFVTGDDACVDFPNGERIKDFRYYSPKSAQTLQPLRDAPAFVPIAKLAAEAAALVRAR